MSVFNATISRAFTQSSLPTTPVFERRISLLDNAKKEIEDDDAADVAELDGTSLSALSRPSTITRAGRETLRENLARRKYAKYQKDRYEEAGEGPSTRSRSSTTVKVADPNVAVEGTDEGEEKRGRIQRGEDRIRRGQAKVKGLLGFKKRHKAKDGDSAIDILWENQRGTFLFGKPYYSAQSLLNFDRPAWTNQFNTLSAVDITNAQLPDPHWEWVWKSWYVDMSLDVDDQGWQYSFMFQDRFPWHGTHPWGYSFVRRRRWIRKRVRKHRHLPDGRVEGNAAMRDAHRLNADYFTIHPTRSRSADSSYPSSTLAPQGSTNNSNSLIGEENDEGVDNVRLLLRRLRRATMDREKVKLVLRFLDEGGQEVHYLADEMPHIMSLFMYQYSRRHLLTGMLNKVNDSSSKTEARPKVSRIQSLSPPQSPSRSNRARAFSLPSAAVDEEQRRTDLRNAVRVADEQVRSFEFWSDIRDVVQSGQSAGGVDTRKGWDETWEGLDRSGPGFGIGEDALHSEGKGKGKGPAA